MKVVLKKLIEEKYWFHLMIETIYIVCCTYPINRTFLLSKIRHKIAFLTGKVFVIFSNYLG